jgi:hypothetical protein
MLIVIAVLAALACAAGFVYYRRRTSAAHKKGDPLQKSLLGADELEMGSLGPKVPHTSLTDIPHTVGGGGDQELSVFSAFTKAVAGGRTGTMSKKKGAGSSWWENCFFSIDAETRVLSWQASKTAKSRLGHMRVEGLFKLPERDGKKGHRFDVAGTGVTIAREQTCQQTIHKRRDELQHAHDALSAGLTADGSNPVLEADGSNPGVEQSADVPSTADAPSIAKQIELAKAQVGVWVLR